MISTYMSHNLKGTWNSVLILLQCNRKIGWRIRDSGPMLEVIDYMAKEEGFEPSVFPYITIG